MYLHIYIHIYICKYTNTYIYIYIRRQEGILGGEGAGGGEGGGGVRLCRGWRLSGVGRGALNFLVKAGTSQILLLLFL